eukprot:1158867-Pelagomonas_calceolata.AAC.14
MTGHVTDMTSLLSHELISTLSLKYRKQGRLMHTPTLTNVLHEDRQPKGDGGLQSAHVVRVCELNNLFTQWSELISPQSLIFFPALVRDSCQVPSRCCAQMGDNSS